MPDARPSRRTTRRKTLLAFAGVGTALLAGAWVPRILAGLERGFTATPRGFAADLVLCLVALPIWCLPMWRADGTSAFRHRLALLWRALLSVLWVLVHWAGYEHVRALDAPLALHQIGYVADAEFLHGSAFAISRPLVFFLLLVGVTAGATLPRVRVPRGPFLAILGVGFGATLLLHTWPAEPSGSWRTQSVVGSALLPLVSDDLSDHISASRDPSGAALDDALVLPSDLSGTPWAAEAAEGRSVILLILEGVSGAYLPTIRDAVGAPDPGITLPRLDALAGEAPTALRMVNPQRQTNRGLWSLLCGRLPRARATTSYLATVAFSGRAPEPPCLPAVLDGLGMRTVFFQAAPLGFMQKDLAMPLLGFREVLEYADVAASDAEPLARSGWGVDDKTFLRQTRREVARLRRDGEPYFLTVLTAGTHHPYAVPGSPSLSAAMSFLDEAVGELFDGLRQDGVLDDTLVLVTSDESAGAVASASQSGGADVEALELTQSHGLVIFAGALEMRDGELRNGGLRVEHPAIQADLPLSLLDHLGRADESDELGAVSFGGRSLFRHYPDDRPIPFANTYLRRVAVYAPGEGVLISCDEAGRSCRRRPADGLFGLHGKSEESEDGELAAEPPPLLRRWLGLASDLVTAPGTRVPLRAESLVPIADEPSGTLLFAGQYFDLPRQRAMVVHLAGIVEGEDGWMHLRHDLVSNEMQEPPVRFPALAPGDSFVLRYRLVPPEDLHALSVRAAASRLGVGSAAENAEKPLSLRLSKAELSFEERPEEDAAAERPAERPVDILRWTVDRASAPPILRETWDAESTDAAPCAETVDEGWRMVDCAPGEILAGPLRYVASGSRLEARWRLHVERGQVTVRAVAGSRRPPIAFAQTPALTVAGGESRELALGTDVEPTLNHVLLALFLVESTAGARWRVERVEVAVTPP